MQQKLSARPCAASTHNISVSAGLYGMVMCATHGFQVGALSIDRVQDLQNKKTPLAHRSMGQSSELSVQLYTQTLYIAPTSHSHQCRVFYTQLHHSIHRHEQDCPFWSSLPGVWQMCWPSWAGMVYTGGAWLPWPSCWPSWAGRMCWPSWAGTWSVGFLAWRLWLVYLCHGAP